LPAVQVGAHLGVDVVLAGPVGPGGTEGLRTTRRAFPVCLVVVPSPAGRVVAVHQQAQRPARPAVEVLLPQAPSAVLVGPGAEGVLGNQKAPRGEQSYVLQGLNQAQGGS